MSRVKVHKALWGKRLREVDDVLERSVRLCNVLAAGDVGDSRR